MSDWLIIALSIITFLITDRICTCIERKQMYREKILNNKEKDMYDR